MVKNKELTLEETIGFAEELTNWKNKEEKEKLTGERGDIKISVYREYFEYSVGELGFIETGSNWVIEINRSGREIAYFREPEKYSIKKPDSIHGLYERILKRIYESHQKRHMEDLSYIRKLSK